VLCVHRLLVAMIQTTTTTGCKCLLLVFFGRRGFGNLP
jgi:hypothetical protein